MVFDVLVFSSVRKVLLKEMKILDDDPGRICIRAHALMPDTDRNGFSVSNARKKTWKPEHKGDIKTFV